MLFHFINFHRKRGNISPLSTRACLAAWPSNNVLGASTNSATVNSQVLDQGTFVTLYQSALSKSNLIFDNLSFYNCFTKQFYYI